MTDVAAIDEDSLDPLDLLSEDPPAGDEDGAESSLSMFESDTSTLFPDQRRCLHALLKHRYLSAERHPDHWQVLLANAETIRGRLNELFFELFIDRDHQIAFKRQAVSETGDPLPSLLRDVSHTKEETIMMVYLRQRLFSQRQEGVDVVFVDRQTLLDEVADHRPEHTTHRAMDQKRALKAIDGLATAGLLLKTADPDRFRISPITEILMPVEKLRTLWTWLMEQNGTPPDGDTAGTEDEDEEDDEPDLLTDLGKDNA
ncbi:DUF4194 domain-containing protein [Paenarthrobacter sp. NPDC090522]|uniref:DUF4194 domain-containing protein n=1 Tax=Paenarthrobacter sp. NPDC090522 TaxID=3364383 RepID=UPI00380EDA8B